MTEKTIISTEKIYEVCIPTPFVFKINIAELITSFIECKMKIFRMGVKQKVAIYKYDGFELNVIENCDLDEFIKLFEWVLQCPSRYTSILNVVTGMTKISFIKKNRKKGEVTPKILINFDLKFKNNKLCSNETSNIISLLKHADKLEKEVSRARNTIEQLYNMIIEDKNIK